VQYSSKTCSSQARADQPRSSLTGMCNAGTTARLEDMVTDRPQDERVALEKPVREVFGSQVH
jgi:hypothetical protein